MKILLKGGHVVDPFLGINEKKDILVNGDKIEAVESPNIISVRDEVKCIDIDNLYISPGLVDIHVHLREPGQEWKETIASGAEAAVAGGFTDVCCMPNTKPVNDSKAVTDYILDKAKLAKAKIHPIGAITMQSKGESLAPYGELTEAGCVAFSDDGRPVSNSQIMRRALEYCKMLGRVLTVHEEDLQLSAGFSMNESALSLSMGLKGMPDAAENVMITRDIELARLTKGRVHFCHVSTARGVQLIKRAKEDGIPVTAEVSPHHLFLDEKSVIGFNTQAKMSMPLRSQVDIDALLDGLNHGIIDCIASDHAPHETDSKNIEFDLASFGMLGLQTTLPIVLTLVSQGKISLNRAIESLTSSAWKSLDYSPKSIKKDQPADITIFDPDRNFIFTDKINKSKSINTPLFNREFKGCAVMTMVNGIFQYEMSK